MSAGPVAVEVPRTLGFATEPATSCPDGDWVESVLRDLAARPHDVVATTAGTRISPGEGLVRAEETAGKRVCHLTEAGQVVVDSRRGEPTPWETPPNPSTTVWQSLSHSRCRSGSGHAGRPSQQGQPTMSSRAINTFRLSRSGRSTNEPDAAAALSRTRYNTVREVGTVTVASYLAERGLPVPEVDLVAALDEMLGDRLANPAGAPLPTWAQAFLGAHAGMPEPGADTAAQAARDSVAALAALVETSLAVPEAAERLGIDASRVRHRIAAGSLTALRVGRANRLPAWQFIGARALPHLRALLGVLPADLHPVETAAFVTSPQPELELSGRWVSPHEWLASGGQPRPVLELAHALGQPR